MNVGSLKIPFVLYLSYFLWWCEIKCLQGEMTWGEWHSHHDAALGYYWPDLSQKEDRLLPECGWSRVAEIAESETTDKGVGGNYCTSFPLWEIPASWDLVPALRGFQLDEWGDMVHLPGEWGSQNTIQSKRLHTHVSSFPRTVGLTQNQIWSASLAPSPLLLQPTWAACWMGGTVTIQ